jgi:hypothetical protein
MTAVIGTCRSYLPEAPEDRLVVPIGVVAEMTGAANDGGEADLSEHQVHI